MLPKSGDSGELRDLVKEYVRLASGALVETKDGLAGIRTDLKEIYGLLRKHGEDIATLKVKAGLWGLLGGMIPAIGVALYFLLSHAK